MIIRVYPKISSQLVFDIPEYFRNRDFWLNVDGQLRFEGRHYVRLDKYRIKIEAEYAPLAVSEVLFTDE